MRLSLTPWTFLTSTLRRQALESTATRYKGAGNTFLLMSHSDLPFTSKQWQVRFTSRLSSSSNQRGNRRGLPSSFSPSNVFEICKQIDDIRLG